MPNPIHGPDCKTLSIDRIKCPKCGRRVFSWVCTCRKQLMQDCATGWTYHNCNSQEQTVEQKPPRALHVIKLIDSPQHDVLDNPLIECRFCGKRMKGRSLAGHIKRQHPIKSKFKLQKGVPKESSLGGVEIQSPILMHEIKALVIDPNGFLVSPDIVVNKTTITNSEKLFYPDKSLHPLRQSNVYEEIKSTNSKKPAPTTIKIRPHPYQLVICPICNQEFDYCRLFDHVRDSHKEKNPKMVLAEFNREYDRLAR